jgi:hypothetical protein
MGLDKAQPISSGPKRASGEVNARPEWSVVVLAPLLVAIALWSVPEAIQAGDAGEFATVMLTGGVPHPSGYPLMRLLGLLAQALWALGLPPATAAALPPAACGVGAWLLVHRCCVALGRPWIGAFVVSLAAASPLVVLHVNDSEVWGPHLLLCALFLQTVIQTRAKARPFLLGILLGLALSQHLTAVLLVPLAIAAALPPKKEASRGGGGTEDERAPGGAYFVALVRNGGLGLVGSLLGLLPYASLALGEGGGWRWGRVETLEGLLAHVSRQDFGTFSLSLHEEEVSALDSLARALGSLGEVVSAGLSSSPWTGLVALMLSLVLAGLWVRRHPSPAEESRSGTIALGWALALLASAVAFPAMANIDPTSTFGAWILERFDLLTVLLWVVPLCLALAWLDEATRAAFGQRDWVAGLGGAAIAIVLLLAQIAAVLERGRPADERGVELAAIDLVSSPDPAGPAIPSRGEVPVRAIVFGTDDHRTFPVLYVQAVLGAGPHTLYIDAELLAHPWYRARLRERVPGLPDVDKPLAMIGAIWSDPALAEVPIYLANVFSRPAAELAKVPEGVLWRVPPLPELPIFAASEWSHEGILARHLAAYGRMRIQPEDFGGLEHPRGHPWSADLWHAYVDKARLLASALARAGREDGVEAVAAVLERRTGAGI